MKLSQEKNKRPSESNAIRLSKRIVTLLKDEDYHEACDALKMAKILLPTPAARRRIEQKQEEAQEADTTGNLVPADEDLMRFSKAMGRVMPAESESDAIVVDKELEL